MHFDTESSGLNSEGKKRQHLNRSSHDDISSTYEAWILFRVPSLAVFMDFGTPCPFIFV